MKLSCPALSQLGCFFPHNALVTCWPVRAVHFHRISQYFSSNFLPALSDPSVGVLTAKFWCMLPQPEEQLGENRKLCWETDRFTLD